VNGNKARVEVPGSAGRTGRVWIDGEPVHGLTGVSVDIKASGGTEMTLTHRLGGFEADLESARVLLDDETRKVLVALGWTPPSGQGETFHIATCRVCGSGDLTIPFPDEAERNSWVERHVTGTGHAVESSVEYRTVAP
jgi:hypothetical protein